MYKIYIYICVYTRQMIKHEILSKDKISWLTKFNSTKYKMYLAILQINKLLNAIVNTFKVRLFSSEILLVRIWKMNSELWSKNLAFYTNQVSAWMRLFANSKIKQDTRKFHLIRIVQETVFSHKSVKNDYYIYI